MSDKYVEINNTDFTGQFESKSNIGNFVTNRQEVVDSYNTGTTLDCYDVLFSNFDIFDSSLTGVPDNIKYSYNNSEWIQVNAGTNTCNINKGDIITISIYLYI